MGKKIAIVGSGISSISAAYYLKKLGFEITLFEAADYFGGHTHTHNIGVEDKVFPVDTGFLVHNDRTYPKLIKFFNELGIKTNKSKMSFSVRVEDDDLEWAGSSLKTLFSQKKNLLSFKFYSFVKDILKFNRNAESYLKECDKNFNYTLGNLLDDKKYGKNFAEWYLLPMGGCIWSTPVDKMFDFPAATFLRFCINHGLLQIFKRPQWKSIIGGCNTYTNMVINQLDKTYLNEAVLSVKLDGSKVLVQTKNREEYFDYVVLGTHAPDSNKIVKSTNRVSEVLSSFKYQKNIAILHLDESLLPKKKVNWSAWNYTSSKTNNSVSVSYLLNELQELPTERSVIVTLNPIGNIDSNLVIKTMNYEHPVFDSQAIKAQSQLSSIQGIDNIFYAGAWSRYGFHEDGILSSLEIINLIKEKENL